MTNRRGNRRQTVLVHVQTLELSKVADGRGQLGQVVVREHELLQGSATANRLRQRAERVAVGLQNGQLLQAAWKMEYKSLQSQ